MKTASPTFTIDDFSYPPAEKALMLSLLARHAPQRIAEFGSGNSTCLWAKHSKASITTWDNFPDWVKMVQGECAAQPWSKQIEFRAYDVTPPGPRSVTKDPVPYTGAPFDFLFLDGPRSAHESSYGRSGTFRFAAQHAQEGACVIWHDAQSEPQIEWAFRCFRHCVIHQAGRLNWCIWHKPTPARFPVILWNLCHPRYWRFARRFSPGEIFSSQPLT